MNYFVIFFSVILIQITFSCKKRLLPELKLEPKTKRLVVIDPQIIKKNKITLSNDDLIDFIRSNQFPNKVDSIKTSYYDANATYLYSHKSIISNNANQILNRKEINDIRSAIKIAQNKDTLSIDCFKNLKIKGEISNSDDIKLKLTAFHLYTKKTIYNYLVCQEIIKISRSLDKNE